MKSGYGVNQLVTTDVSSTQSSATTPAQNAVSYFSEFNYEMFWRLLEQMGGGYNTCLLYTSPSPPDGATSRMPSSD